MSDLQCPATIVVVRADPSTEGRSALLEYLGHRHCAAVQVGPGSTARAWGQAVADRFGVPVTEHDDLRTRAQLRATIADLADQYRGETLILICGADLFTAAAPDDLPPELLGGDRSGWVSLEVDSDGWRRSGDHS